MFRKLLCVKTAARLVHMCLSLYIISCFLLNFTLHFSELSCLLDCVASTLASVLPSPIWSPSRFSSSTCSDHPTRLSARCLILIF
uniref:Uncharacterized protein n=2 Tax=Aegilops tauschii subsp. strangulata TaxID=200361 RepID=A0A453I3S5_AEGTS